MTETAGFPDLDTDPKLKAIQMAAFEAFRTYGFRRTSMEDIARGAGISRSALYLHFRNKEDIFRSLVSYYYLKNTEAMAQALAAHADPEAALVAALAAKDGEIMEAILTSAHGAEIMDSGFATSQDIAEAGEARFAEVLADWIAAQVTAGRLSLPTEIGTPLEFSETLLLAAKGLKQTGGSAPLYAARRERLARMAAASLLR